MTPGLCSITFRALSVKEVVRLVLDAKLGAIEWGGDIHVPHGDVAKAREVAVLCREEGIATPTYGSYFRFHPDGGDPDFRDVLEVARALEARTIRVWAGVKGSRELEEKDYRRLVEQARAAAILAEEGGCQLGFEYHLGTATDTNEAALRLLGDIAHPAVRCYWQPLQKLAVKERRAGLEKILPYLAHLHVFQWVGEPLERRPLADGAEEWRGYFDLTRGVAESPCAFLEFVAGDAVEAFRRDAATLKALLGGPG